MLKLIVVPLDGSAFSQQVLPLAVRLAERHGAEIELVHVFEALAPYVVQGAPPIDPLLDTELRRDRQKYLQHMAARVGEITSVKIAARVLNGTEVVTTLTDHLTERGADLVVMATHGRGGFSRMWIGSVAMGVVRRSSVPVLLVRTSEWGPPNVEAPELRRILVPLDGTPADEDAIESALAVAERTKPEFLLLHVREPVTYFEGPGTAPLVEAEFEAAMSEYLNQVARRIESRGFSAMTHVMVDLSPSSAILQAAEAWNVELIVLETHARSGASLLLHGNVTDKVIRGARVPVLVHHGAKLQTSRSPEGATFQTARTPEPR